MPTTPCQKPGPALPSPDFADQVDGALRRPDPRAGAFGEGLADVHQAAAQQGARVLQGPCPGSI